MKIRILHMQDKKLSQEKRMINLMKRPEGAMNYELNRIGFRYSAIIHRLRKDGHIINTKQLKTGLFNFRMES